MNMEQNPSVPALERDQNPKASTFIGTLVKSALSTLGFCAIIVFSTLSYAGSLVDQINSGDVIDGALVNNLDQDEWEKVYRKLGRPVQLSNVESRSVEEYVTRALRFYNAPAQFRSVTAVQKFTEYYIICGLVNGVNQYGVASGYQPFRLQYNPAEARLYFFQSPLTHPGWDGRKQCSFAGITLD